MSYQANPPTILTMTMRERNGGLKTYLRYDQGIQKDDPKEVEERNPEPCQQNPRSGTMGTRGKFIQSQPTNNHINEKEEEAG